jgi:hypothetical protein
MDECDIKHNISLKDVKDVKRSTYMFIDDQPCKVLKVRHVNKHNKYDIGVIIEGINVFTNTIYNKAFKKQEQVVTFSIIKEKYPIVDIIKNHDVSISIHCQDQDGIKIITTEFYHIDINGCVGRFVYAPVKIGNGFETKVCFFNY